MSNLEYVVREGQQADADAIATVHEAGWRAGYAHLFPQAVLERAIQKHCSRWARVLANPNFENTTTVAGQPTTSYAYDDASRLTSIGRGAESVTLAYDDASRLTSTTFANNLVTNYDYNAASLVSAITYKQGANALGELTYSYDEKGP